MADKNILLIEPSYKNKYPPLGLMKIAQYHGSHGKGDRVRFIKGEDRSVLSEAWDRIYVTTLFSLSSPGFPRASILLRGYPVVRRIRSLSAVLRRP